MSSNAYSACLTPDRRLRSIVVGTGWLLAAIGFLLIVTLPFAPWLRLFAGLVWVAWSIAELRRFRNGYGQVFSIRVMAGGAIELRNGEQEWVEARLQNGSVLLRRYAWLRLKLPDGGHFAELIRGNSRESQQWRRLQVIWRHIGALE